MADDVDPRAEGGVHRPDHRHLVLAGDLDIAVRARERQRRATTSVAGATDT